MSDELTFYVLGVLTPFIGLFAYRLLSWLIETKTFSSNWRFPIFSGSKKKSKEVREGCPECGSPGRHKKTCSHNKEGKKE